METTLVEPFKVIERKVRGELEGFGRRQFASANGSTQAICQSQVVANKSWVQFVAPIARPLFEWNHDMVMDWSRQGLIKRLADKVEASIANQ